MALISEFFPLAPERVSVHGLVACGFHSFKQDGKTYLQLDTYGSGDRAIPGKVSQTIQVDRDGAKALLALILEAFPVVELAE